MTLRTQSWYSALFALAFFFALAWLSTAAQAQVAMTIAGTPINALPGSTGVSVFGSLTNSGTASVDLDNAYFNLISGPSGADLTSALSFSDYSAPFTLSAGQVYSGALFTVDTAAAAPLGSYLGNFSLSYGGQTVGQDVTFNLGNSAAVPEAGTGWLMALGLIFISWNLWRRRQEEQPLC